MQSGVIPLNKGGEGVVAVGDLGCWNVDAGDFSEAERAGGIC